MSRLAVLTGLALLSVLALAAVGVRLSIPQASGQEQPGIAGPTLPPLCGSAWPEDRYEDNDTLDAASAVPEPYPMWHQHKFGIERNPRLPSIRP